MPKTFDTVEERRAWERDRKRRQRGRRIVGEMLDRNRSQVLGERKLDEALIAHPHVRKELQEREAVFPTQAEQQDRLEQVSPAFRAALARARAILKQDPSAGAQTAARDG